MLSAHCTVNRPTVGSGYFKCLNKFFDTCMLERRETRGREGGREGGRGGKEGRGGEGERKGGREGGREGERGGERKGGGRGGEEGREGGGGKSKATFVTEKNRNTYTMVYAVDKVIKLLFAGFACLAFAGHSLVASVQFFLKSSAFLGAATLLSQHLLVIYCILFLFFLSLVSGERGTKGVAPIRAHHAVYLDQTTFVHPRLPGAYTKLFS